MKQTLQLRLGQHLTMTPQLQQAIRLLQLSTLDLRDEIQQVLESNLMLEMSEDSGDNHNNDGSSSEGDSESDGYDEDPDAERNHEADREIQELDIPETLPADEDWEAGLDNYGTYSGGGDGDKDFLLERGGAESLRDHLLWQMNLTPFADTDLAIALAIIDSISENGYLTSSLEEIRAGLGNDEISLDEVEAVLHRIQHFDPPGVGARSVQECLLLQLQELPPETPWRDTAILMCRYHFAAFTSQDLARLRRLLGVDEKELGEIVRLIRSLHPHPGTQISTAAPEYLIPDVFVVKRQGLWRVELNPDATPRLRVNSDYARLIRRADTSADNNYLKHHLQEARWFIKSLESRNETLLKVARQIVELQRDFFEDGPEAMHPLVLRDVAEALGMHESTISRVTSNKYMHTPRGILEFKFFFSSHVSTSAGGECSATAIRAMIKKLIAAEAPGKPLSDITIANLLTEQGIQVARRTVAKYREAMGIPSSSERKRLV